MTEKELQDYQDKLMSGAKGTMKLGILTGVGGTMIGHMSNLGPATAPVSGAVQGALGLAAIGNMAAVGMSIVPGSSKTKKSSSTKKKSKGSPMDNPAAYF